MLKGGGIMDVEGSQLVWRCNLISTLELRWTNMKVLTIQVNQCHEHVKHQLFVTYSFVFLVIILNVFMSSADQLVRVHDLFIYKQGCPI